MHTIAVRPEAPEQPRRDQLLHALMSEHAQALLVYTKTLLSDHHTAEDIVQETLIRAWNHAERLYRTEGSIRGWLFTVARNLVIDRLRSAACRHETVGANGEDVEQPSHVDATLASMDAFALLSQLSREHREILVHVYLYGRTINETADILGIPPGTVKSRRHYALNNMHLRATGRARNRAA